MKADHARHPELERRLAQLLRYGTWLGSLVIAAGLVLIWVATASAMMVSVGTKFVTLGIAIFIFLPILRVAVMLTAFLRDRDYWFAVITTVVLGVIASGAGLGIYLGNQSG